MPLSTPSAGPDDDEATYGPVRDMNVSNMWTLLASVYKISKNCTVLAQQTPTYVWVAPETIMADGKTFFGRDNLLIEEKIPSDDRVCRPHSSDTYVIGTCDKTSEITNGRDDGREQT